MGVGLLAVACNGGVSVDQEADLTGPPWPQWGQNSQHGGSLAVTGQAFKTTYLNYTYDPLVPSETANNQGGLLAHYMTPLTDSDGAVYMETKSGTYSPNTYSTQTWGVTKFNWNGSNQLIQQWSVNSDWKAPGSQNDFWEPVFHGALANGYLYVPGGNGTILKLNKNDGSLVSRINPTGMMADPNTFTTSPITVDAAGNLYFTVLKTNGFNMSVTVSADESFTAPRSAKNWHAPRVSNFFAKDVVDSWLVKVASNDTTQKVSFSVLVPNAPKPKDNCLTAFSASDLPWPPSPTAVPPTTNCGTTRTAIAAAPAVGPDGTIFVVARTHFVSRYGFLVAVNSDLTPKWSSSLRDRMNDGCGVPYASGGTLPPYGEPGACRAGSNYGVDPATNRPGGGRVLDDSSSSPVVAPDGSVYYGAYSRYNFDQGHIMHFDAKGNYLNAYPFGWDTTPAVYVRGGTFSLITKDNHYNGVGSYCDDDTICPSMDRTMTSPDNPEVYRITQLNPDLTIDWTSIATNQQSCTRDAGGNVTCVTDHPHGFEWCVNAPAVDANGTVYVNSEDGWLYKIPQPKSPVQADRIFQQQALGAAYTPASLGTDGKVYSQNSGHLFVIGN
jgi:hypothetical protein